MTKYIIEKIDTVNNKTVIRYWNELTKKFELYLCNATEYLNRNAASTALCNIWEMKNPLDDIKSGIMTIDMMEY